MNLTELARDPKAFDTAAARLHEQHDQILRDIAAIEERAHQQAGDKRRNAGRTPYWQMSLADALARVPALNEARETKYAEFAGVVEEITAMGEVYSRAPWTRFFPSITDSHPHIHRSLSCRTLHHTTRMSWAPQMSGQTEAEAVEALDEALCTVCFPSAPVALHNYVSRRSQAEQDTRAAERAARDAAKAVKNLTGDQQFDDHRGDRVTTVAAAKQVLREEVELRDYYGRGPHPWHPGSVKAAETAKNVLLAREAATPGTGATQAEIDKIIAGAVVRNRKAGARI